MTVKQRYMQCYHTLRDEFKHIVPRIAVPFTAILLAFLVGAVILALSGSHPFHAYSSLFHGALGSVSSLVRTLEKTTPLLFSGLAIAFAFKAGLFNIGAQGQLLFGALAAAVAGFSFQELSPLYHIPLALFFGAVAGGIYGALQGVLKAYTGAHEVITGIMLNYIAINLTDYLSSGPYMDPSPGNIIARTPVILSSAQLPHVYFIPFGFIVAVLFALMVWSFQKKTPAGFAIQTVGANIHAARYAGINVRYTIVFTLIISGALAGVGGAVETQGITYRYQPGFNTGLGFEGITIALLGRTHPLGVIFASLLFGAMKTGASHMQFSSGVSTDLIDVIMALILFFVAADIMIRRLIRIKDVSEFKTILTTGWAKP